MYKKESLELLRQRIDLPEVLSPHVQWHRSGSSYKACCPFHEERTPSFSFRRAIATITALAAARMATRSPFLMTHLRMTFVEAVEPSAERSQVPLEKEETRHGEKGAPQDLPLKDALEKASRILPLLLFTPRRATGAQISIYRGLDLEFIRKFQFGPALQSSGRFLNKRCTSKKS